MSGSVTTNSNSKSLYILARDLLLATNDAFAKSFLTDLPSVESLEERPVASSKLAIISALADLGPTVSSTDELVTEVKHSAPHQAWRQPYDSRDFGADFSERSGWFPIADRRGPLVMTEGLVEIMLLGGGVKYPMHSHAPEELYLVLAGEVWWEAEGEPEAPSWRFAGDVIHHHPYRRHALTAGDSPVLVLLTRQYKD